MKAILPATPTGTRLLGLAIEHVRRYGLQRTTVVGVAEQAGLSHAAVYRYFPSKDALIDAITAAWLKTIEVQLAMIADAPDPADDKLERLLHLLARLYREHLDNEPNLYDLWLVAVSNNHDVARNHRIRVRSLIDRVMEEGRATGHFRGRSNASLILFLADALFRFIDPHAIKADRKLNRPELDERMARVLRVVIRALSKGAA